MTSIDDLFRKPNLPSSHASGKRKFEASDAQQLYKSAKLTDDSDAKGKTNGSAYVEDDSEDVEAGPDLPPEEEDDAADEEGRFFGGGVTRDTTNALDYLETADGEEYVEEKIDAAWTRRLVTNFERKISKNAEQRARFEDQPQKFMASEAELDAEIKSISILTEHSEFYTEFVKAEGASHLVSLLAHENTDIAINAIEIISELIDEDIEADQDQWTALVEAMLDADLPNLLVQNFARFDEAENESDRQGVYHSLAVLESLASQGSVAERVGNDAVLEYLLKRIQAKEQPLGQNKQYAAEVLQVLLQSSDSSRVRFLKLGGVDTILHSLSAYRRRDPGKDSHEEEYAEDIFDALTCVVDVPQGKHAFVEGEGIELMLIMLREGKFSKARALKVIDHATGGQGEEVAERLVEAAGLKTLFTVFMKKPDHAATEHLLGIFAAMLRLLPGESPQRIRTLGKFVEKDYEKITKLMTLRREYVSRVTSVDAEIRAEQQGLTADDKEERQDEWFSRRLDAGLYCQQTLDVVLAWLVAEDSGSKQRIEQILAQRDETTSILRTSLQSQLEGVENTEDENAAEMLKALIDCLR